MPTVTGDSEVVAAAGDDDEDDDDDGTARFESLVLPATT